MLLTLYNCNALRRLAPGLRKPTARDARRNFSNPKPSKIGASPVLLRLYNCNALRRLAPGLRKPTVRVSDAFLSQA
jgi:hypothetical protein